MHTKEHIKKTGATFTPEKLAAFLVDRLINYINKDHKKILDPACGDGELLVAIGKKLLELGIEYDITGIDSNKYYLDIAHERLSKVTKTNFQLKHEDFLQAIKIRYNYDTYDFFEKDEFSINKKFDLVVANPPYVRTQLLGSEQAQYYAKKFALKGRVDLYFPFLIGITESVMEGGIIAVITSNRYLTTRSGESIRKFLSQNYDILELIDLGDTKLFDAAVLPAIFIGRKTNKRKKSKAKFIKVYETQQNSFDKIISLDNVYKVLTTPKQGYFEIGDKKYKKTVGILKYSVSGIEPWQMFSEKEAEWISQIEYNSSKKVSDYFKVRVGIKSTADDIFIKDNWDKLGKIKPESTLLKELISQENIEPWGLKSNDKLSVLYPHFYKNGKRTTIELDEYPKAKEYLKLHFDRLSSRKYVVKSGRKWFELWVPQNPNLWKYPKLIFPDISAYPRFYFDEGGKIVNGNCYWIVATNKEDIEKLLLIQGVANSKLMTKYHDLVFNNRLYAGRRRYITQYVEKYPLPDIQSDKSKKIIETVKILNSLNDKSAISENEKILEVRVAEAFNVEPIFNLD